MAPPLVPAVPAPSPGKIDKSALTLAEPRRRRDKEHLRFVATQPCLVCGRQPCDPHHLRFAQPKAMGVKVSDEFTVPLCRGHHRQLHQASNEIAWWKAHNIDALPAARQLWEQTHPNEAQTEAAITNRRNQPDFDQKLMTTEKQFIANQQNAKNSTGPRTERGKRRSRRNALRHGLTAETVIEALENRADYEALASRINDDYRPRSKFELELVARLVSLLWRLRRAVAIESGLFDIQANKLRRRDAAERADKNRLSPFYALIPALVPNPQHCSRPAIERVLRYILQFNLAICPRDVIAFTKM